MAYEIVAVGTSILWGQGLLNEQKIHTKIKKKVEESHKSLIGAESIHVSFLAHSGAVIGFNDDETENTTHKPRIDGEVPTHYPTLLQQLAEYDEAANVSVAAEKVNAVLVEGSVNDVNIMKIFDPLTTSRALERRINRYCYRHMLLLLKRVAAKFPNARIVVAAYYPMLSAESEDALLAQFLHGLGATRAGRFADIPVAFFSDLVKHRILNNASQFYEQSKGAFQKAIEELNAESKGKPRIFLAVPAFTSKNTVFASDPWLFGINPDLSSQDPLAAERAKACDEVGEARTLVPLCKRASNGHPNEKGAEAYAEAIIAELLR